MPKLPVAAGKRHVSAFLNAGWHIDHWRGSHAILAHPEKSHPITVPCHQGQMLAPGTLRRLINDAGLTRDEYIAAFEKG